MSVDWKFLRAIDGSQQTGFEELCRQLAQYEDVPNGSDFFRIGAPDAGVECYWKLPNEEEIGWQAKFFLSPPSEVQWKQVDRSVKTALEKHPKLTRFIVCFPLDRQDPRIPKQEWMMDKWTARVQKWQEWAREKGISIFFDYWGEGDIWDILSRSEHRGRNYFWFSKELFDQRWFENQIKPNIENAGDRYTPELNFDLPIAKVFDGLGQTQKFFERLKHYVNEIEKRADKSATKPAKEFLPEKYNSLADIVSQIKNYTVDRIETIPNKLNYESIINFCSLGVKTADEIHTLLKNEDAKIKAKILEERKIEPKLSHNYHIQEKYDYATYYLWELQHQFSELKRFINSDESKLANIPFLLMIGNAGNGKTHLFCDIAEQRLEEHLPTILLLGQHFESGEPFSQILKQLGLSCTRDEFLGALEATSQSSNSKALILIDALNESNDRKIWKNHLAGMIETISNYKWISLAVSVRSTYKDAVIPSNLDSDKIIEVEHHGFGDKVFEATDFFFKEYGIKAPSIPILNPEFQNPLFLKTFCAAIRNFGLTEVPKGLQGITSVFDFYVQSINKKLSLKLGFDEKENRVKSSIERIADVMIEKNQSYLLRDEAKEIVGQIHTAQRFEDTLFYYLLSDGVLSADIKYNWTEEKLDIDTIRFTYERFTDNLMAKRLLDNFLNPENPQNSFLPEEKLGKYLKDEYIAYQNKGIIEALCVQLPERINKELFEVAPQCNDWEFIKRVFIQSLMWREPTAIFEASREFVNKHILFDEYYKNQFWDAILIVSTNPEHSWNARFLHQHLNRFGMAERDAWWSIFLHEHYSNEDYTAIHRLIDWAWSDYDKSHIDNESILLCGITLSWFLTSSNRFLRDSATKALVALLTNRIRILKILIGKFLDVNDFYVLERLFAVAYGCVMRSNDNEAIAKLAQATYNRIFKKGNPIPHFLIRDYASGIIELALARNLKIKVSVKKIRPPYKSQFPETILSENELREKYYKNDHKIEEERIAQASLYDSVMKAHWDSSMEVINDTFLRWRNRRIDEPIPEKVEFEIFERNLSKKQQRAYERYKTVRHNINFYNKATKKQRLEIFKNIFTKAEIKKSKNHFEEVVRQTLTQKKIKIFNEVVIPYLDNPDKYRDEHLFDVSLARRWILNRIFELGWSARLFGYFDRWLNYNSYERGTHKPERIGKKYQWLAYFEFLAYVADNFQYNGDNWSYKNEVFLGAWQDNHRDIDPSSLLKKTESIFYLDTHHSWWFPIRYDYELFEQNVEKWLRVSNDLPEVESLIQVTNPSNNSNWFNLNSNFEWREDTEANLEKPSSRKIRLWYDIESFFVKKEDLTKIIEWSKSNHFPQSIRIERDYNIKLLLGEFYWSPAYEYSSIPFSKDNGWINYNDRIPTKILPTITAYSHSDNGYDCSVTGDDGYNFKILLPTKLLVDEMNLNWNGKEGLFFDESGELIVFDPSVRQKGNQALLIKKDSLIRFLEENELEIFWILRGEKMSYNERVFRRIRPLEIRGIYYLENAEVKGRYRTTFEDD